MDLNSLWYDLAGSARELFREFGCSERVYKDAFNPMLLVGLFAPGELCSAAACLGMLYYFILAHQVLSMSLITHFLNPKVAYIQGRKKDRF